jgi:hypothetical protein
MDAKELQAHILNNYGKPMTEMGFVELIMTLKGIDDAARYEYERWIESAEHEQWQKDIDEDLQREIDEYHQMTIDNELPF